MYLSFDIDRLSAITWAISVVMALAKVILSASGADLLDTRATIPNRSLPDQRGERSKLSAGKSVNDWTNRSAPPAENDSVTGSIWSMAVRSKSSQPKKVGNDCAASTEKPSWAARPSRLSESARKTAPQEKPMASRQRAKMSFNNVSSSFLPLKKFSPTLASTESCAL